VNKNPEIFIYTALPCEAKPLIARLRLKRLVQIKPFAVYCNETLCLTVTGVGKTAMAAGVAYSRALFAGMDTLIMINIGVAGHKTEPVGTAFIAHKIADAETGRKFYPVLAYSPPCLSATVVTASKPQLDYAHDYLCDMEASAFYETASRFATGELIQCLKIVSDNQSAPAEGLDARQVTELIDCNITQLMLVIDELTRLAAHIAPLSPACFDRLCQHYRFTASERMQLKNLLTRWQALTCRQPLPAVDGMTTGKEVLRWLEREVNAVDVVL